MKSEMIKENIAAIRAKIEAAAVEAGRDPKEITLVGASKMNDADACKAAIAAGIDVLGENLVASLDATVNDDLSGDLAPFLTATATSNTSGITLDNITEENDGDTVSVTVSITFNPDTSDNDGMDESASLAGSTITLEQTAPASNAP